MGQVELDGDSIYEDMVAIHGENGVVDITDKVTCYEKGKTWECPCGQGFGTGFSKGAIKCPTCGKMNVDRNVKDRSPPVREEGQAGLTDFV